MTIPPSGPCHLTPPTPWCESQRLRQPLFAGRSRLSRLGSGRGVVSKEQGEQGQPLRDGPHGPMAFSDRPRSSSRRSFRVGLTLELARRPKGESGKEVRLSSPPPLRTVRAPCDAYG